MVFAIYFAFTAMIVFLIWSKRRIDRNEPILGSVKRSKNLLKAKETDTIRNPQSIHALLDIENVQYGIVQKGRNEYCLVLSTDSVNYDLLTDTGKQSTILGYEQLFKILDFPIQIVIQAVRQDSRNDIKRYREHSHEFGSQVSAFCEGIIEYIEGITLRESRIVKRVYYIISYVYEPSSTTKMLHDEDRMYRVMQEMNTRAIQVKSMLKRAHIQANQLTSLKAIEVIRRTLNRDRTLAARLKDVESQEMLALYVTSDSYESSNPSLTKEEDTSYENMAKNN